MTEDINFQPAEFCFGATIENLPAKLQPIVIRGCVSGRGRAISIGDSDGHTPYLPAVTFVVAQIAKVHSVQDDESSRVPVGQTQQLCPSDSELVKESVLLHCIRIAPSNCVVKVAFSVLVSWRPSRRVDIVYFAERKTTEVAEVCSGVVGEADDLPAGWQIANYWDKSTAHQSSFGK